MTTWYPSNVMDVSTSQSRRKPYSPSPVTSEAQATDDGVASSSSRPSSAVDQNPPLTMVLFVYRVNTSVMLKPPSVGVGDGSDVSMRHWNSTFPKLPSQPDCSALAGGSVD